MTVQQEKSEKIIIFLAHLHYSILVYLHFFKLQKSWEN